MRGELAGAAVGIPLRAKDGTIRAYAMVDAQDLPSLSRYRWSFAGKGYVGRRDYSLGRNNGRAEKIHRTILGLDWGDKRTVDHINHDPLDNRRSNLRVCAQAENCQNHPGWRESSSKYRGVSFDKPRGKWRASAKVNYRQHFIGRFDSELEAAEAAAEFRRQHMSYAID